MLCFSMYLSGHSKRQDSGEPGMDTPEQVHSCEPGPQASWKAPCGLEPGLVEPTATAGAFLGQ